MKNLISFFILISSLLISAQQTYYPVTAGNGNGVRFWNSDLYKIHMGNTSEYQFGPVTDFSIKMNMSNHADRGWTWGLHGVTPIAALNTLGDFQVARNLFALGNVGIGTTTPAYKLHVTSGGQIRKTTLGVTLASAENSWIRDEWLTGSYGPAKWNQATAKWIRPSGAYNDIGGIVYQDEGTYFLREKAGTKLEYTNSEFLNTAYMYAAMWTGNIGIGTITPQTDLDVIGNSRASYSSSLYAQVEGNASGGVIKGVGGGGFLIRSYGVAYFNGGNVGIGTTTPDSKLTVAGNIHAQEVKVTVSAGADFVFNDDYKLPSLKEVEQFIKTNNHLPEIASEKEMQDNGLLLAEMNIKLLQKIEELTLYTIQQEKQLEIQKNQLSVKELKIKHLENKLEIQDNRLNRIEELLKKKN